MAIYVVLAKPYSQAVDPDPRLTLVVNLRLYVFDWLVGIQPV